MKVETFAIDVNSTLGIEMAKIIDDDDNGFVEWPKSAKCAEWVLQRTMDDDGEFVSEGLVLMPVSETPVLTIVYD